MKRYLMIMVWSIFMFSCKKETEGISRETKFPVLTMNGKQYEVVANGATFTDPGVEAKEGEKTLEVKVDGSVNTAVNGVYDLTYSAINSDGFPATITRFVVVYSTTPAAAANDLTGKYARSTNQSEAVWKKVGPGVYTVFNPGGAPGTNLTVVAVNPDVNVIDIPEQVSSDGSVTSSSGETYNPATGTYSWIINNPTYGTAPRTFNKL